MSDADELGLIFSEEQVGKYTIKAWTLRQFQALLPIILAALDALKERGLSWEEIGGEDQEKTVAALQEAVRILIPQAARLLAVSLGISEEEAGDLDLATASLLLVSVVAKNFEHLKNLPARLMATVGTVSPGASRS